MTSECARRRIAAPDRTGTTIAEKPTTAEKRITVGETI